MKALIIMLTAAFFTVSSFGQNTVQLSTENNHEASIVKTKYSRESSQIAYHEYGTGECARYHKIKVAGIVLSSVGGGLFITGAILTVTSPPAPLVYDRGYYYRAYDPQRAGGGALMTLGGLSMGVGIPLAIIGGVKGRRYCSGAVIAPERSYLELHNGSNGTGLALKF